MDIKEICESIEKAVLEKVFHKCRERLTQSLVGAVGGGKWAVAGGLVENT
jgi:hypothetical protein